MNAWLEQLIRDTVRDLATSTRSTWVDLTALRDAIPAIPRAALDEALLSLVQRPEVHLIPEANRKALTDADREAALICGGQEKHLICIEIERS